MGASVSRSLAIFGAVTLAFSHSSSSLAATPTATPQSVITAHDVALSITLRGTSPDGQPLTFNIVSTPSHGTLGPITGSWAAQAQIVYTPHGGYVGDDAFTFAVSQSDGASSPATVSITVGYAVSGSITLRQPDGSFTGLANYQLRFRPTSGPNRYATTKSDGSYWIALIPGWSGTVNAYETTNYSIEPVSRIYSSLAADQPNNDYVATAAGEPLPPPSDPPPPDDETLQHGPDFDGDGDADMDDYGVLQRCLRPGAAADPEDLIADLDGDEDVDLDDVALFEQAANGASIACNSIYVGRTYFVSNSGSDSWSGGLSEPNGAGSDGPLLTIQKAATLAQPGDTICIRGGTYDLMANAAYVNGVICFANSGQPGKPITVSGYGSEIPILRSSASKAIFDFGTWWGNSTAGFGHYVFRKLKITGGRCGWMFYPPSVPTWDSSQPVSNLWVGQLHDFLIEDVEADGNGTLQAAIYARNAGVRDLTVRRCNFHHTIGTEGTIDLGEWMDEDPAHAVPASASHNILIEDCDLHHVVHQQGNGIVTQPCVFNVTMRRCRVWNNGKYGIAFKGSGNFRLDRCAVWGNRETSMYCRGFGGDSGAARPPALNDFLLTNCIFIAPPDQYGGSALNWRENCSITAYNCTIVGLRETSYGMAGGYAFLLGNDHAIPVVGILCNCIVAGFNESPSIRFVTPNGLPYVINVRYEGSTNLLYSPHYYPFRYQGWSYTSLAGWQGYWATGAPNGDDGLNGPRATYADSTSFFADPAFVYIDAALAPIAKQWSDSLFDPANHCDVRLRSGSPTVGSGANLAQLNIPELMFDYEGNPRPASGPWTIGALQNTVD